MDAVVVEGVAPGADGLIDQDAHDNPGIKFSASVAQSEEYDVGGSGGR